MLLDVLNLQTSLVLTYLLLFISSWSLSTRQRLAKEAQVLWELPSSVLELGA
jgi:hypothetical protein